MMPDGSENSTQRLHGHKTVRCEKCLHRCKPYQYAYQWCRLSAYNSKLQATFLQGGTIMKYVFTRLFTRL